VKDALGRVESVLVLGGGSEIGLATARALVARGTRRLVLAARAPERLESEAAALRAAGADVALEPWDATDVAGQEAAIAGLFDRHGDLDVVLAAAGVLDGAPAEVIGTNFLGLAAALAPAAERLRAQGHGTVVVLSSVAGERARRSNYLYGSSKAGLDAFAQGLGDALAGSGVGVLVVRPGFVRTKMTAGLDPAPLATTPEKVADAIVAGLARGSHTVWVPGALRWVMSVLRHLPRPVFRRLDL
jgi:decaprenylphospho-beta-D-erythro-pentofuranosid-2-ulose 2-reductase